MSTALLGVGILLGFLTSAILLPNYFSKEENGVLTLLQSYSLIYSQFALMGVHTAVLRFFPHFKNESTRNGGFLTIMSGFAMIGITFFTLVFFVTRPYFDSLFQKSPLFEPFYILLLPVTIFYVYYSVFDVYSTSIQKPVRGFFLKDVLQRLLIIGIILLIMIYHFSFSFFVMLYCIVLCVPTFLLFILLVFEKQFSFRFISWSEVRKFRSQIYKVGGYSMLLGISWVGITNLDAIMIERMLNLELVGVYGRTMYFGLLVAIPYRAIHKVASGHISEAFKENRLDTVKEIYYKSCINQFILALLIFGGIWLNIDNVFHILPESYKQGKYVIFYIGLGNLISMLGGVNTAVISFSPYFRWNTYLVVILLILVAVTNLIFIPLWGLTGAAIATALSLFLYNFMMWVLLWIKYGFQPFNLKFPVILMVFALAYGLAYIFPSMHHFFIDLCLKSIVFFVTFSVFTIRLKLSPDINNMLRYWWHKMLTLAG